MRKQRGHEPLPVFLENITVGARAEGHLLRSNPRKQHGEAFLQRQPDRSRDLRLGRHGIAQRLQRLPHRQHDVGPGVPERPVEIQDDQPDHSYFKKAKNTASTRKTKATRWFQWKV